MPEKKLNKLYDSPTSHGMLTQGRMVEPLNPESFEPSLKEIKHSLPMINRYNGHGLFSYSVADHSINCASMAHTIGYNQPHHRLYFLLHDAAEAYLQDLIRPIKRYSSEAYSIAEEKITRKLLFMQPFSNEQLEELFSVSFIDFAKELDTRMAVTEMRDLFPDHNNPIPEHKPYNIKILYRYHRRTSNIYSKLIDKEIRRLK